MSDLASLMQIAPGSAAFMMGQNNTQSQQSEALRQQELQQVIAQKIQESQQAQQMNPLLLQQQQNKNQYDSQGKLPELLEKLRGDRMKNDATEQTQPSDIHASIAKNLGTLGDEDQKAANRFMDALTTSGQTLWNVPPPERINTLTNELKSKGFDTSSPLAKSWLSRLSQMDAEQIPHYMTSVSDSIGQIRALQNPALHNAADVANIHADSAREVAGVHGVSATDVANINAQGKLNVADRKAQAASDVLSRIKSGQVPPDKGAVQMEMLSQLEEDPVKKQQYQEMAYKLQEAALKLKREGAPRADTSSIMPNIAPEIPNLGVGPTGPLPAGQAQRGQPGTASNPIKLK
jgi:hypothetical protein